MILIKTVLTSVCNISNMMVRTYNKCSTKWCIYYLLNYTYISLLIKTLNWARQCLSSGVSDSMPKFQRTVTCKNCLSCESKAYKLFKKK